MQPTRLRILRLGVAYDMSQLWSTVFKHIINDITLVFFLCFSLVFPPSTILLHFILFPRLFEANRYCKNCTAADSTLVMTTKAPARKSSRKRTQRDYANLNAGIGSDPGRWLKLVETKPIKKDPFKRMQGADLERWLAEDEDAMTEPIVIEQTDGLGMKMPPKDLTVEHVAEYIGEDTPLEVMGEYYI